MGALFLHAEEVSPEFTLKFGVGGGPLTVSEALTRFALAYGSTGYELTPSALELVDSDGKSLAADALLPCGLPDGADAFVRSSSAPEEISSTGTAAAAAKAAIKAAASGAQPAAATAAAARLGAEEQRQKGVYAAPGSAIAASQAKMGENSYYYSVGKNRTAASVVTPAVPAEAPKPKAVVTKAQKLPEVTISSYSMLDDDSVIKVYMPLAGAGVLPEGAISATFRERSFDLKVTQDGKILRLHIPILGEEVVAEKCVVKKKTAKLIIQLVKKDADKGWHELRKTKGVGDSEYGKLVPDSGEPTLFTI